MDLALKRELSAMFGVSPDDLGGVYQYRDHQNRCYVFRRGDRIARISDESMRHLCPPKDPFIEAFEIFAMARHEARKRAERKQWL